MENIKIAILGAGTVGTGVYKLMERQKGEMIHKIGSNMEIAKILVRNKNKSREGINRELLTDDFDEILNDESISIVVEVMGGIEPAKTYIEKALRKGKHIVTANKDLMASEGHRLMEIAKENKCDILFEAAVAGAIPIIRPLKQCLAGNYITEIMGIVNGTTNFILTKMTKDGMEFDEALKMAQELGYAEADPTADIEGYDAGRKIAIMASIAFNSRVTFDDVYTEGITKITAKDIKYAKDMECDIKLLGVAKNTDTGIEVKVHPMLIPSSHPLASVNDSFNAVFVHGDAVDDAMFMGRGAGELPTASAVMGDIIDVARNIEFKCSGRIGCTCYKNIPVKSIDDTESKYFMRMQVDDRPGVLASVASVLGNTDVGIDRVIQKTKKENTAELVVITDSVIEKNFKDALAIFKGMAMIKEISSIIRVY
ncbi:MAG: homoserine dehydrogenase [Clostridia bacterium]|nr:homoserine dehydrogenase [Clostridia bacterium]